MRTLPDLIGICGAGGTGSAVMKVWLVTAHHFAAANNRSGDPLDHAAALLRDGHQVVIDVVDADTADRILDAGGVMIRVRNEPWETLTNLNLWMDTYTFHVDVVDDGTISELAGYVEDALMLTVDPFPNPTTSTRISQHLTLTAATTTSPRTTNLQEGTP